MSVLRRGVVSVIGLVLVCAAACSEDFEPTTPEATKTATARVIGKCQTGTFHSVCDPDDGGPLTECQGLCEVASNGQMECFAIAELGLPNVNGQLCGPDGSCSSACSGTQCVSVAVPEGLPCRPSNVHDRCAGECIRGSC